MQSCQLISILAVDSNAPHAYIDVDSKQEIIMGTRSLTHIKQEDGSTLLTIYRQFDGYPSVMGADIQKALAGELVNGIGDRSKPVFNGMGCAAAALVKALKDDVGNVYIYPVDSKECGEEYVYTISPNGSGFNLEVREGPITMFGHGGDEIENLTPVYSGPLADFEPEME